MDSPILLMLREVLRDCAGPDFAVLARQRFRIGIDTVVTPDLAVVADVTYRREKIFRPASPDGLNGDGLDGENSNTVPILALILDFRGTPAPQEWLKQAQLYFARGTRAVCFASPDCNSLMCYLSEGVQIRSDLTRMEGVLHALGVFNPGLPDGRLSLRIGQPPR